MMDEKPKRGETYSQKNPNIWAYVLIGIGLLILLANLGIIAGLTRLWPLLLIGLGLWIIYGRSNPETSEIRHERFTAALDGAETARVKLNLSVGEATVVPSTDPDALIDAEISYFGDVQFVAQGEQDKFISLSQTKTVSMGWFNPANWFNHQEGKRLRWDVALNPHVPTDLDVHGGLGKSTIDLRRFNLTGLDVNGGVGEVDVTLPASANRLDARLQVGVGQLNLTIPSGASVNATVKGGIGETNITIPADAAVRVEAKSGVGELNIPSRMNRLSGAQTDFGVSKKGVWETPDFASSDRQIVIYYDGGIGELNVR